MVGPIKEKSPISSRSAESDRSSSSTLKSSSKTGNKPISVSRGTKVPQMNESHLSTTDSNTSTNSPSVVSSNSHLLSSQAGPVKEDTQTSDKSTEAQSKKEEEEEEEPLFDKQINACCLDYLLSECVPLSMRVQVKQQRNETDVEEMMKNLELKETNDDSSESICENMKNDPNFGPGRVNFLEDEQALNSGNILYRIQSYGFEVGYKITDCIAYNRVSKDGVNLESSDTLEIMKFICRDVWKVFYHKQMDNLRTNHVGTFVLIDNNFRPLLNFYSGKGEADTLKKVVPYLQFPSGLIRGVLSSLGIKSLVKAGVINGKVPAISFSVQTNFDEKE